MFPVAARLHKYEFLNTAVVAELIAKFNTLISYQLNCANALSLMLLYRYNNLDADFSRFLVVSGQTRQVTLTMKLLSNLQHLLNFIGLQFENFSS